MEVIELKNINLQIANQIILTNFNLKIKKGDKILISGKSGKGKSTILKILLGFTDFDTGKYLIDKHEIKESDFTKTRQLYAYINQDVSLRNIQVKKLLKEVADFNHNKYLGQFDTELADKLDFDMKLLDKYVSDLSGGERVRLGIIIAVMLDRPVYLLDEITAALDEELKEKVVAYFSEIDATVISVSHDSNWKKNTIFKEISWWILQYPITEYSIY